MQKITIALTMFILMVGAALADTLYLRDGSVLKGAFISFDNNLFTFETNDGKKVQYMARNVLRLVVDRDESSGDARYRSFPKRDTNTQPPSSGLGSPRWESATPFDVRLNDQWTSSQIEVRKGQRIRVEATGTITLEGRTAVAPEGLRNQRDRDAPMPSQNDGALIAVIGKEDDAPLILVGRQSEFVADRDGMLFFSVNHWETRNAGGAFRVTVSLDRGRGGWLGNLIEKTQRREKTIAVPGNQAWIDTGIDVESNATIEIMAEGQVAFASGRNSGPDGDLKGRGKDSRYPIQSNGVGALIAKIRYRNGSDSALLFVGSRGQIKVGPNEYGRLFFGINDDKFGDNSGSFNVTIRY